MVAEQQNNHGDDVQDRSKADWQQECEKFMNGMKLLQESSRTQGKATHWMRSMPSGFANTCPQESYHSFGRIS
jgi:hypothetical protein